MDVAIGLGDDGQQPFGEATNEADGEVPALEDQPKGHAQGNQKEIDNVKSGGFSESDFASRGGRRVTRYADHCPVCSLDLRKILSASKADADESADSAAGPASELQRENPEEYKKVFKDFKDNVPAETGGRSKKRQGWKPQQLVVTKSHEATKQSRWAGNYEEMRFGRYLTWFTAECDLEDRMTDAEARIAWMREPSKHKIKIFSHKEQKTKEVEVVSVETSRTRHQEQIGSEKQTATQVVQQVNNASEQQISAAKSSVMSTLSEAFEDDMFSVFWL
eukprot:s300_g20.t1